ncbi:hypothetical protein BBP40_001475 [Aspergillus hancockii]|nr:hypothetical protein BBP40_001475 [Aspergillus hancockii]
MPVVLHALLALSALNLYRSDPSRRSCYLAQAQAHHEAAIRSVVPIVPSLATENSVALFLFSSLTYIYSCAKPPGDNTFLVLFECGHLSEWVRLFRGTKTIIEHSSEDFMEGSLGPIFMNGAYLTAIRRDERTQQLGQIHVQELRMICDHCTVSTPQRQVYLDAVDGLGRTLAVVLKPGEGHRLETADVFAWLLEMSEEYLELLRQEAPAALIVFAYFCVAIKAIEWMWWMEGLSARLMSQLESALDAHYHGWLQWPRHQNKDIHEATIRDA